MPEINNELLLTDDKINQARAKTIGLPLICRQQHRDIAQAQLDKVLKAGYVLKDPDQSLPSIEIETIVNSTFDKFLKRNKNFVEIIASMMGSTMISKGWVKVKEYGGET